MKKLVFMFVAVAASHLVVIRLSRLLPLTLILSRRLLTLWVLTPLLLTQPLLTLLLNS